MSGRALDGWGMHECTTRNLAVSGCLITGALSRRRPDQSRASITLNSRAIATAGPRIPTRGTNTDGIQAAAKSPIMARAWSTAGTVRRAPDRAPATRRWRHKSSALLRRPVMNASIPAALLMLLLAGGWWLGRRRPRPFLRSTDTTAVADLNRAQIERMLLRTAPTAEEEEPDPAPAGIVPLRPAATGVAAGVSALPQQRGERRRRLRQLHAWMLGSREQRLQALAIARVSSGREVLPLLRLGLRDPDPAVMAAAAAAMERFRGRPTADRQLPGVCHTSRRNLLQPVEAARLRPRSV